MTYEIRPIKTKKAYREALRMIDRLFDAKPGTREGEVLEVMAVLVEAYEAEHYPIDAPDPVEAIRFRMEQAGLGKDDIVEVIGSRSRVSEIFNGKRKLTIRMIRNLHRDLGIPAESLIGRQ